MTSINVFVYVCWLPYQVACVIIPKSNTEYLMSTFHKVPFDQTRNLSQSERKHLTHTRILGPGMIF
jgi:hypothetical protein